MVRLAVEMIDRALIRKNPTRAGDRRPCAVNFRSLMAEVPHNTICVYSFSKNSAASLASGVIATHEKNTMDRRIAELPAA